MLNSMDLARQKLEERPAALRYAETKALEIAAMGSGILSRIVSANEELISFLQGVIETRSSQKAVQNAGGGGCLNDQLIAGISYRELKAAEKLLPAAQAFIALFKTGEVSLVNRTADQRTLNDEMLRPFMDNFYQPLLTDFIEAISERKARSQ
ncbi:MAG: hypothetical protein KDD62_02095 [Bdellovibrionales bacterium]|nr:hypothetical protein [Bdellovibrionales bacterium]